MLILWSAAKPGHGRHTGAFTTRSCCRPACSFPTPATGLFSLWQVPPLRGFFHHLKDSQGPVPGPRAFPGKGAAPLLRAVPVTSPLDSAPLSLHLHTGGGDAGSSRGY